MESALFARDVKVTAVEIFAQLSQTIPVQDEQIRQLFSDIADRNGAVDGFLYLSAGHGEAQAWREEEGLFFAAKHFQRVMRLSEHPSRKFFITVSHLDGQLGRSGTGNCRMESSAIFGLLKTLQQEWPTVFCRALDMAPELTDITKCELLMEEIVDCEQSLTEVGCNTEGRWTVHWQAESVE